MTSMFHEGECVEREYTNSCAACGRDIHMIGCWECVVFGPPDPVYCGCVFQEETPKGKCENKNCTNYTDYLEDKYCNSCSLEDSPKKQCKNCTNYVEDDEDPEWDLCDYCSMESLWESHP